MSRAYFDVETFTVPGQHVREYRNSTASCAPEELRLAVKCYRPKYHQAPQAGDVTVLACTGIGLAKELHEPVWDELYHFTLAGSSFKIRAIWIADFVNQGASAMLNEGKLGIEPSWFDFARDYLGMVNHFRAEMPQPLIGIGHSFGASVLLNLALLHPRLLSAIVAVEPIIMSSYRVMGMQGAFAIMHRIDHWPSRNEAMKTIRAHPMFKGWDPRVLKLFEEYAFRRTQSLQQPPSQASLTSSEPESVTLMTTKDQEVAIYSRAAYPPKRQLTLSTFRPTKRSHPDMSLNLPDQHSIGGFYRPEPVQIYGLLPTLRPPVLYIYGPNSQFETSSPSLRAEVTRVTGTGIGGNGGVKSGRVREQVTKGGTHFVVLERPSEVVWEHLGPWLGLELQRWKSEEDDALTEARKTDTKMQAKLPEDFRWWMDKLYRKDAASKDRRAKTGGKAKL